MGRIVYTDLSGRELSVPLGPEAPVVTIGRATDCTIRSNRKSVSRHHAEFHFTNGRFEVIDLGSSNGTYLIINDERRPVLGREFISHSDEVWCGDFILRFYDEATQVVEDELDSTINRSSGDMHSAFASAHVEPDFGRGSDYGSDFGNGADFVSGPPTYDFGELDPPTRNTPFEAVDYGDHDPPTRNASFGAVDFSEMEPQTRNVPFGMDFAKEFGAESLSYDEFDDILEEDFTNNGEESSPGIDLSRLQAEKDSIEELAARQAMEVDDLRNRLSERDQLYETLQSRTAEQDQEVDALQARADEQARELEQLRRQLEQLQRQAQDSVASDAYDRLSAEFEAVRGEQIRLKEELNFARQTSEGSQLEQSRASELEYQLAEALAEIDVLRTSVDKAGRSAVELVELREIIGNKERDIKLLEDELERSQAELRTTSEQIEHVSRQSSSSDKVREESDALRKELERQGRLLSEFERRNRELQVELDAEAASGASLRELVAANEERLDELESAQESHQDELKKITKERDKAVKTLDKLDKARLKAEASAEEIGASVRDLKNEIEGLKRRLKMEKDRAKGDEGHQKENERLNARVLELEGELETLRSAYAVASGALAEANDTVAAVSSTAAISPQFIEDLRGRIDTLDRIVDAIERTDLQPLTTVDRIRLQSAIRDTTPKKTLQDLRRMTSEVLDKTD